MDFEQKMAWEIMTKFPVEIEIPGLPTSVNHTYGFSNRRVFKNSKARAWETIAKIKVRSAAKLFYGMHDLSWAKGMGFELHLTFVRETWRGKSKAKHGLYVRPDVSNFIKLCEDSICSALCLDDSAVVKLSAAKKEEPGEAKTRAKIIFLERCSDGNKIK
jgi:Holliday junction resolvase RusA-like endonuclease